MTSKLHPPSEEEEEDEVDGEEPGGGTFKVAGELYERTCDSRERRRAVLWTVKQTFLLFLSIFTTPPPPRGTDRVLVRSLLTLASFLSCASECFTGRQQLQKAYGTLACWHAS